MLACTLVAAAAASSAAAMSSAVGSGSAADSLVPSPSPSATAPASADAALTLRLARACLPRTPACTLVAAAMRSSWPAAAAASDSASLPTSFGEGFCCPRPKAMCVRACLPRIPACTLVAARRRSSPSSSSPARVFLPHSSTSPSAPSLSSARSVTCLLSLASSSSYSMVPLPSSSRSSKISCMTPASLISYPIRGSASASSSLLTVLSPFRSSARKRSVIRAAPSIIAARRSSVDDSTLSAPRRSSTLDRSECRLWA